MARTMISCFAVAAVCLQCASAMSWPSLTLQQPASRRHGPVDQAVTDDKPWFCHDNECPPFEVLKTTDQYEVRSYGSGDKWIASATSGLVYSTAVSTGFKRLYQYTNGDNDKHIKVPLTTPVLTKVTPSDSTFKRSNFTVAVWLPSEFQEDPPKPTDAEVEIITPPSDKVVYVLQFGGFLVDDVTVDTHATKLKQALLEDRIEFDEDHYFTATYDKATQLTHRHNEVWYAGDKSDSPA